MSHFTTIKIQMKDGQLLKEVLEELGYQVEYNARVRGYQNNTTAAEYVIRQANGYDLGFRRNGENYELVADFWGAKIKKEEFINQIAQSYARKNLLATARLQGFDIEEEETLTDGTVRVVVGRWV
ncbi:MAG TPA: DUF1257 domain-containing protein [Oscillatoriaceae cyanobacterium M33_DOE_052]|uniref:DUF1257 domain-containing protein n=1 Tax=Planktothricoides sp. SpSt-374 TaxID=2282167 RepID=A0A7C3VM93_9CYAN|nr:DUF1257 domain-containing protein [Oscillatoriaceae cyanobacterium M33_DOE_052]